MEGIIESPVFTQEGRLIVEPGYDRETRLWYHPVGGLVVPSVPDRPTDDDIAAARRLILDLLADFPFDSDASRANAVALMLLPFVRAMIDGPTPLHAIDAPTEGTGKGLLVDCCCLVSTGREARTQAECHGEEEWSKVVTSILYGGQDHVFFDNVAYPLNSATLAEALTSRYHQGRVLGKSKMVTVPVRLVWITAGNNLKASKEITRRMVLIRLDAGVEHPDQRSGFRHENLRSWVKDERGKLVWACLTLCQGWIAAGRRSLKPREPMGSYEAWAGVMSGLLTAAGITGFLDNRQELISEVNNSDEEWRELVLAWFVQFGNQAVSSKDVHQLCVDKGLMTDFLADCKSPYEDQRIRYLGLHLSKRVRKVYGSHRIELAGQDGHKKTNRYRIVQSQAGATG